MAILKVSGLGTPFVTDPAISLKNYISTNYIIATPPIAQVNFDTKFSRMDKPNIIVIEKMPKTITAQNLGSTRFRYDDVKRVQIFCTGKSSINNRYLIEEHIEDIINANPLGMQADGIKHTFITEFQEISRRVDNDTSKVIVASTDVSRSFATVFLRYEKYVE